METTHKYPLKKKVDAIKRQLDQGGRVYLHHENYEIKKDGDDYIIHHIPNNYIIGLEWLDGSGCNLNPNDVIIMCFKDSTVEVNLARKAVAEFFLPRKHPDGYESGIEVTTLDGEWIAEIGTWFDKDKRLVDYDGIYDLSFYPEAIAAMRKAGYVVPKDMIPTD